MPSKFSEFLTGRGDIEPEFMEVEGSFGCQLCFQQVDQAKYYPLDQILIWECPSGHKSYAEEFVL